MNTPYFNNTALPVGSVPMCSARSLKLTLPISCPMGGMMTSATSELTILPNAAPITTPTARSMTLPFIANSLNSEAKLMVRVLRRVRGDSYLSPSASAAYENETKAANKRPPGGGLSSTSKVVPRCVRLTRQRPSSYGHASAQPPLPVRQHQPSSFGGHPSSWRPVLPQRLRPRGRPPVASEPWVRSLQRAAT